MKQKSNREWAKFNARKLPVGRPNRVDPSKPPYDRRSSKSDIKERLSEMNGSKRQRKEKP